jgi:hypothetical protein
VIREELSRLARREEHHRRLIARVSLAIALTLVVDVVGSVAMWRLERDVEGSGIGHFGDAVFFTTVQLLTVSSQLPNPLTGWGKVVDVGLEIWAIFVVTAVAGSFAAFFSAADRGARRG